MFIISWVFDKLGYMPKVSVDTSWPFPAAQQDYVAPDLEFPIAKKTTRVAKKTTKRKVK